MKMRVWPLVAAMVVGLGLMVFTGQPASAQAYPNVADLQPFTPSAQYMSLPGYLRWQVFVEQGRWISRSEAVQVVAEQTSGRMTAGAPSTMAPSAGITGGSMAPSEEIIIVPDQSGTAAPETLPSQ